MWVLILMSLQDGLLAYLSDFLRIRVVKMGRNGQDQALDVLSWHLLKLLCYLRHQLVAAFVTFDINIINLRPFFLRLGLACLELAH